jgi:hypothetical protein
MTHKLATVSQGVLYGEQTHWRSIPLDSAQWFAWLETPAHVSFSYALYNASQGYIDGFVTLRKEQRQRGGAYWTAYRRQGRRLRKLYLGPSAALTYARLQEVASHLRIREGPCRRADIHSGARPSCALARGVSTASTDWGGYAYPGGIPLPRQPIEGRGSKLPLPLPTHALPLAASSFLSLFEPASS